ncbi:MAG: formate dehydrogenase subunit delta [Nocardioides sp.]
MSELEPEVRMGNDIARQFAHLPREQAVVAIAAHIGRFWEPRMRAELQRLSQAGKLDDPLLAAAAETI